MHEHMAMQTVLAVRSRSLAPPETPGRRRLHLAAAWGLPALLQGQHAQGRHVLMKHGETKRRGGQPRRRPAPRRAKTEPSRRWATGFPRTAPAPRPAARPAAAFASRFSALPRPFFQSNFDLLIRQSLSPYMSFATDGALAPHPPHLCLWWVCMISAGLFIPHESL